MNVEKAGGSFAPSRAITTDGRSDARPQIHSFTRYRDLFNDRQLLHLSLLGQAISRVEDPQSRKLLAPAFSKHLTTNCMYTAYAFGYRRISPMFAIHGFRHVTRPVEINPLLDGIGRGTFPNVLGKIAKAVAFATAPTNLDPKGGRKPAMICRQTAMKEVSTHPWRVLGGSSRASISTKTSESLEGIKDGIMVFTYHHKSRVAWGALGEPLSADASSFAALGCTRVALVLRRELHSRSQHRTKPAWLRDR